MCTIDTWADFKRDIKKQFYPEDVEYMASQAHGVYPRLCQGISSLMLEALGMDEKDLVFNFMDNLQS